MIKLFKYALATLTVVLLGAILVLIAGSRMSMDRELAHARAARALAGLTPASGDGLVNIRANGMDFRARVAGFDGDPSKPAVILLHGFPVTSAMWIGLIEPLARAGYRVVAFDQRGYSPAARPEALAAYAIDKLTSDVVAVADAIGAERFHLAGHDWGAAVGWSTVLSHPQRILSWTALSIAHPAAFAEALTNDPDQQARSSYFAFFRTPWLPEAVFSFNGFGLLKAGVYDSMSSEQAAEYLRVFSEPGALTAALNWYRAMDSGPGTLEGAAMEVAVPTLFIWGNRDEAVGRAAIDAMDVYITGPYRKIELDAGHWLMENETERIAREVIRHVNEAGAPPSSRR